MFFGGIMASDLSLGASRGPLEAIPTIKHLGNGKFQVGDDPKNIRWVHKLEIDNIKWDSSKELTSYQLQVIQTLVAAAFRSVKPDKDVKKELTNWSLMEIDSKAEPLKSSVTFTYPDGSVKPYDFTYQPSAREMSAFDQQSRRTSLAARESLSSANSSNPSSIQEPKTPVHREKQAQGERETKAGVEDVDKATTPAKPADQTESDSDTLETEEQVRESLQAGARGSSVSINSDSLRESSLESSQQAAQEKASSVALKLLPEPPPLPVDEQASPLSNVNQPSPNTFSAQKQPPQTTTAPKNIFLRAIANLKARLNSKPKIQAKPAEPETIVYRYGDVRGLRQIVQGETQTLISKRIREKIESSQLRLPLERIASELKAGIKELSRYDEKELGDYEKLLVNLINQAGQNGEQELVTQLQSLQKYVQLENELRLSGKPLIISKQESGKGVHQPSTQGQTETVDIEPHEETDIATRRDLVSTARHQSSSVSETSSLSESLPLVTDTAVTTSAVANQAFLVLSDTPSEPKVGAERLKTGNVVVLKLKQFWNSPNKFAAIKKVLKSGGSAVGSIFTRKPSPASRNILPQRAQVLNLSESNLNSIQRQTEANSPQHAERLSTLTDEELEQIPVPKVSPQQSPLEVYKQISERRQRLDAKPYTIESRIHGLLFAINTDRALLSKRFDVLQMDIKTLARRQDLLNRYKSKLQEYAQDLKNLSSSKLIRISIPFTLDKIKKILPALDREVEALQKLLQAKEKAQLPKEEVIFEFDVETPEQISSEEETELEASQEALDAAISTSRQVQQPKPNTTTESLGGNVLEREKLQRAYEELHTARVKIEREFGNSLESDSKLKNELNIPTSVPEKIPDRLNQLLLYKKRVEDLTNPNLKNLYEAIDREIDALNKYSAQI